MHHCVYLHVTRSNASILNVRKYILECLFENNGLNNTFDSSNQHCKTSLVENDVINIQALMHPEDDLSQENRISDSYMQEEPARSCIYDRAEVMWE